MDRKVGEKRQLGNQTTYNKAQINVIVSSVKFWFSPSALRVSRLTKFDDDMVVASEEFEGGWVGTIF